MKKKIILLSIVFVLCMVSLTGCGKKELYYKNNKYLNFKEVLEAEQFEAESPDYEENDDQAIIYLFRGQGCGFCRNFITFLNSISAEYGKYFKLVSFEVWYDQDNAELMDKVSKVTSVQAGGVPYIIIGDKVFGGYAESYNEDIIAQIMKQYEDKSYDVFEELQKEESKFNGFSNTAVILINLFVVALGVTFVVINSNKNKKQILEKIDNIKIKK